MYPPIVLPIPVPPKAPAIYEMSRVHDIKRTAQEIRAKYIRDHVRPGCPYNMAVLHYAAVSGMNPQAFRQLFLILAYADQDGSNAYPSHQTIAHLTGRGVSSCERTSKELTEGGWLQSERRWRNSSVRKVVIPDSQKKLAEYKILEVSKAILHESENTRSIPIVKKSYKNLRTLKYEGNEPSNMRDNLSPRPILVPPSNILYGSVVGNGELDRQIDAIAQPEEVL